MQAQTQLDRKEFDRAERLYKKALKTKPMPPASPEPLKIATSLNTLGNHYYNQKKYEKAEPLYKGAREIRKIVAAQNSMANDKDKEFYKEAEMNYAALLLNMANLYYEQHKYKSAEQSYIEALDIAKDPDTEKLPIDEFCHNQIGVSSGTSYPDLFIAILENQLANTYYVRGQYDQAEPHYIRAKDIAQKKLTGDPSVVVFLASLANCYYRQNKYTEANYYQSQVNVIRAGKSRSNPGMHNINKFCTRLSLNNF